MLIVLLYPTVTCVSASLRFVIFSSKSTMFYVTPESTINVSLSWFLFEVFAINSLSKITYSVTLSQILLDLFLLVAILFFVVVRFSIIAFLLIILVLVVPLFFFISYLVSVFVEMSGFYTVIKFWYVCTFYIQEVL